jgi:hypothetical protein
LTKAEKALREEMYQRYERATDMQEVIRKIIRNNSVSLYTQTETAIWNDIPDKLRYNYYSEKDGSVNGEKDGVGLRDGPYEASDDSSVKERKKNEERAKKLAAIKDERNITTEEVSALNNQI